MGLRGTKPKPDWLKGVQGNPGKRPPKGDDTKVLILALPAPAWFNDEQVSIWHDVTGVLIKLRALTEGDKFPLQRYVELLYQYRLASKFMAETADGQIVYTVKGPPVVGADGKLKRETRAIKMLPHIKAMLEISNHLLKIENYFGLNPSARAMFGGGGGTGGLGRDLDPFNYDDD